MKRSGFWSVQFKQYAGGWFSAHDIEIIDLEESANKEVSGNAHGCLWKEWTSLIYHDAYSSPRSAIDQAEQGTDVRQYDGRHIWGVQKESREGDLSALVRLLEQVVCTESQVNWPSRLCSRMKRRKYIDPLPLSPCEFLYSNAIELVT